jgi:hypothetical protein
MMRLMKQKLLTAALIVATVLMSPLFALAQEEGEKAIYDARLQNYPGGSVTLDSGSTALLTLLLIVMAAVCVGVMFKNAKRTHLD